jgi:hypothetical protein
MMLDVGRWALDVCFFVRYRCAGTAARVSLYATTISSALSGLPQENVVEGISLFVRLQQKNPDRDFDPGFKLLPRRCRSGDSPVPFRKGWMTVAAEFGFQ